MILLREPCARAYSHYRFIRALELEGIEMDWMVELRGNQTFAEHINQQLDRFDGNAMALSSVIVAGLYDMFLSAALKVFPAHYLCLIHSVSARVYIFSTNLIDV